MTYRITDEAPHAINDGISTSLVTLADEYGGRFHIINDDHCYVLVCEREGKYTQVTHWFREALVALRQLPLDPDGVPDRPKFQVVQ